MVVDAPQHQQSDRARRSARPAQLGPIGTARRRGRHRGDRGRDNVSAHLASSTGTHAATAAGTNRPRPDAAGAAPGVYLTVTYPASGQNVLQFQVRRTTAARSPLETIPAARRVGRLSRSAAGDAPSTRRYACTTHAAPHTTFDRIRSPTRARSAAPRRPAVPFRPWSPVSRSRGQSRSPDAPPGDCADGGSSRRQLGHVERLSTGAVRTWQTPRRRSPSASVVVDGRAVHRRRSPRGPGRWT